MSDGPQHKLGDSDEIDAPSVTAVADEPSVVRETAPEINPGDLLANRYQVEAVLGKGGSGVVLRAFDRTAQALVAVKLLRPTLTHDPRWEKRFSRELRLGRPIRHPNVCRVFDIGDADGYRFLTMELATGGTLRELIKRNEPVRSIDERLVDAAGVIAGLAAIHEAGIVHRDVKTDNILRMDDGRLVLSDFGLATDLPAATMVSVFVGTPHYMAPEVREGEPATTRSDVWSLGVVLHEIFFGRRPERRTSRSGAGSRASRSTQQMASMTERAMFALCERCLADDPGDRPASASEVEGLFHELRESPRSLRRFHRRNRVAIGIALAVSLVASAVLIATTKNEAPNAAVKTMEIPLLTPAGEAADWTRTASALIEVPGRAHCFSIVDANTARLVWGAPRHAEDIDIKSGGRRPSPIAAKTFENGCPELSPHRDRLLFTSLTAAGTAEIRLSAGPDGSDDKAITPGVEPVWLRSGDEFLYSIDPYHGAVFSLRTMNLTLLPDPGLGGRQLLAEKAASGRDDLAALLLVDDSNRIAIAVYEGVPLKLRSTSLLSSGTRMNFDESSERLFVAYNLSKATSTLTALDSGQKRLSHVGRYSGFDLLGIHRVGDDRVLLARSRARDAWLYNSAGRKRLTNDGETLSAAIAQDGSLLFTRRGEDGTFAIWLKGPDKPLRQVTHGPMDMHPSFGPDAHSWTYIDAAKKSIVLCERDGRACRSLRVDNANPSWPTLSPDATKVAYVTESDGQRVVILSVADGQARPIGTTFAQCPPIWSSPERIWIFEGSAKGYFWTERDASTGGRAGGSISLGSSFNDANQQPDQSRCWPSGDLPNAPPFPRVRVETVEQSRVLRLNVGAWGP